MGNSIIGGNKTKKILLERNPDYYREMGRKGGLAKVPKGFALNKELARKYGAINGAKNKGRKHEPTESI